LNRWLDGWAAEGTRRWTAGLVFKAAEPGIDGLEAEASVAAQADVRDAACPGLSPDPVTGHAQHIGDVVGGQQPSGNAARWRRDGLGFG
jgi:hypothetical protein